MTGRRRQGLAAIAVCLGAAVATAAPWASAAQTRRIAPARVLHLPPVVDHFAPFPRRLLAAARRGFRAPLGPARSATWAPFILGGSSASQGTYGYMATIIYYDSTGAPQFLCSGTLVSSNVVLTAGHCGADETTGVPNTPSGYRVFTNAVDWTDTTNRVVSSVSQVIVDPNFNPTTLYGDAAMLVLSAPVDDPAVPLWASGQFAAGTSSVVAGWGKTYDAQTAWTTVLQWAPTVLQNITYCASQAAGGYAYDSGTELCTVDAPYYDTSTCNGDSGGPLLADDSQGVWIEIGITSAVPSPCVTNRADFFTAILPIESWIENEITAATPPPPVTTTTTATTPTPTTTTPTTTTPAPAVKPTLGRLTVTAARADTRLVLAHVFRGRYADGNSKRFSCSRISTSRFNCGANFSFGGEDYYGNVIVYLEFGAANKVYWTDHYTLHWVNDHCYFHSGHRRSCAVGTRRGTY